MKNVIKSFLAGVAISIGCIAFLSCDNKFIGASLFSIGLYMVCAFGLNLYTGKICYVFDNDINYFINEVVVTWFGNFSGAVTTAAMCKNTRLYILAEKANELCQIKFNDNLLSIFLLAILCNMMIYVGVESYKNNPHEIGKYFGIYISIVVFIMAGFEHCIANMFYFTLAGVGELNAFGYLLVMTLGNAVGGILIAEMRKCIRN